MLNLSERLYRVLKKHPTLNKKDLLAQALGVSRSMLYHYEQGSPPPPTSVLQKLIQLEATLGLVSTDVEEAAASFVDCSYEGMRRIPLLGWAHAGHAASYEELPFDDAKTVPTDCKDPKAFAVWLEGDSMENIFQDGDQLILMPSEQIYSGCFAVVRLATDGVVFRRIEFRRDALRLVPLNQRYAPDDYAENEISWAYPIYGSWRQIWKG